MIKLEKYSEVYNKVHCEPDIAMEMAEYFTFDVPNARFSPKVKRRQWDGKIRLFSTATRLIYRGLTHHIEKFANEREYEINFIDSSDFSDFNFSLAEAQQFIAKLKTLTLPPRDYQIDAFVHAVRKGRALLLSPTASGKSLIIYLLCRMFMHNESKILIIVPTTSLVHQMATDFGDYGFDENKVHKIFSGQEKITDEPIVVTTWQSIYKMPKNWFDQFHCVIGDEAHQFKAKSLVGIMTKMINTPYRFGFTGTLDGAHTNKLVLEGLFGSVRKIITTSELMEQGHVSELNIKAIVLNWDEDTKKQYSKSDYQTESDFIATSDSRNDFISNLSMSLKGNTLVLFKTIAQGQTLYNTVKQGITHSNVFYVDGNIDGIVREDIRKAVEETKNAILIASYGTFSTGINIKNLHNVIFASPSKSRIRTLQSIGRGLRLGEFKTEAVLYDIADDLSWKSKKNYTLLHFAERMKIYNEEKFNYKIYSVNIRRDNGIFNKIN